MAVNVESGHLCSNILSLKTSIRRAKRLNENFSEQTFFVLRLERYLVDPKYQSFVKVQDGSNPGNDAYDLTITDGSYKLKCVLSRTLSPLVQKGRVQVGSLIQLTKCSLLFDETDLDGFNFVLVEDLKECTTDGPVLQNNVDSIPWSEDSFSREQMEVPLASSRGCYVSLWSCFEAYGELWEQAVSPSQPISTEQFSDSYTLKELSQHWRSLKASSLPPVIVRVLTKSRLRLYAKPYKADKWPYQIYLTIADRSGTCTAVIWNSLCAKLTYSIQEGSVLMLENYTVKPHFDLPTHKQKLRTSDLSHFNIDVNLNPHHPQARVNIVDPGDVKEDWEMPSLEHEFITRRQLGKLPENFICDVVGVVMFVGRYERVTQQNTESSGRDDFWVIRWVELADQSCLDTENTFYIKLFRSIQGDVVDSLCPGDVLICTHLRVVYSAAQTKSSRQTRQVYLTSTAETQLTVAQNDGVRRCNHPTVSQLMSWAHSQQSQIAVRDGVVGGYFTYPSLPADISDYRQLHTEKSPMKVTPSDQWETVVKSLSYRESRNLLVQGYVVRVCHHSYRSLKTRGKTARKKSASLGFSSTVKYLWDEYASDNMIALGSTDLYQETLPFVFSYQHRDRLLQFTAFPPSAYPSQRSRANKTDLPVAISDDFCYESITIGGLNHPILLHAIYLGNKDLSPSIMQQLSGTTPSSWGRGKSSKAIHSSTATRCLCHLDLHQMDKDRTEIILNAIYRLG